MTPQRAGATATILAGGKSRRMGEDKALVHLADEPLLLHVLRRIESLPALSAIIVAGHGDPREGAARHYRDSPDGIAGCAAVRFVPDEPGFAGPLAGLVTGLLQSDAPYTLLVGCDMPFLQTGLLIRLLKLAPDYEAVVPVWEGQPQVTCATYSRPVLSLVDSYREPGTEGRADGSRESYGRGMSLRRLIEQLWPVYWMEEAEVRVHDPRGLSFVNVNTPGDLQALEELERELMR